MQFQFDIDGQRATLAVFIPGFGSICSRKIAGVLQSVAPLQNYRNSSIFTASLREDRGRPWELGVRSKSGIAPSSSG
eukprot:scaffold82419_cov54-Phaeocystis_antarctica.AAC.2